MRPQTRIFLPLFLGWMAIATVFTITLGGGGRDDAFISYRYARSIAHNDGLVFNTGERYFGADEPGLAIALGIGHRVTRIPIPWLGTLSTALALLSICLVMTADGLRHDRFAAAALGSTLLIGSTAVWVCQGTAAPVILALLLGAAHLAMKRPQFAGALAGAAVWLRPDAALGVLALGLLVWFRQGRFPTRYATVAGLVLGAGMGLAWIYFGTVIPAGLAARQILGQLSPGVWPSGIGFLGAFLSFWIFHFGPFAVPVLVAGTAGWMWARKWIGLPGQLLLMFAAGLTVGYPLIEIPFSPQLMVPATGALLFGFSYSITGIARRLLPDAGSDESGHRLIHRVESGIVGALIVLMAWRVVPMMVDHQDPAYLDTYHKAALWIADNTPANTTVTYHEVGVLGWYSRRPLYDLLGIVSPGLAYYPSPGTSYEMVVASRSPEIVLDHSGRRIGVHQKQEWFRQAYQAVARIPDAAGGEMVIYQKRQERP